RANLSARNWPDPTGTSSTTFDNPTVAAAAGTAVTSGNLGQNTLTFTGSTVSGFSGGGTATNLAYDETGAAPGLGVYGASGNTMASDTGEYIIIGLAQKATTFALTLSGFGNYLSSSLLYTEKVELKFFNGLDPVATLVKSGCNPD